MPSPTQPLQPPRRPAASEMLSSSSSRIPALLAPYVASGPLTHDEGSLTVITWVQGASANWLVLRHLYALLGGAGRSTVKDDEGTEGAGQPGVVLVSFLRDQRFWVDGCAKLGMDLEALGGSGRFSFVDGLAGVVGGEVTTTTTTTTDGVRKRVDDAAARLSPRRRKVLLVDALDALVATTGISASEAESLMMRLRENVYSTLVTLSADEPLMRAAVRQHNHQPQQGAATGLEREQAALVLGQAHAADQVVSLRRLDTGAAADVSGVLRVGAAQELLYHVSGDGGVRVFERGA